MHFRGNSAGLVLALVSIPALVAYAEDPAAGAVQQAGMAVGKAKAELPRLTKGGAAAQTAADAARDAWNKSIPPVVAARRQLEIATERAKSGKEEDIKKLEEAKNKLERVEKTQSRLFARSLAAQKEADAFVAAIAKTKTGVETAIGAAQTAINGMKNQENHQKAFQAQLDMIKADWSKTEWAKK